MKVVTSKNPEGVANNINDAAGQLRGEGGETPPPGFKKVVDVRVQEPSPLANMERPALLNELKNSGLRNFVTQNTLKGVDEVRVTNNKGTHVFSPTEF
jgi:hypothetical protein